MTQQECLHRLLDIQISLQDDMRYNDPEALIEYERSLNELICELKPPNPNQWELAI